MRKSYHSMVVPIALAATTVRIGNFFSAFSAAMSDAILVALPLPWVRLLPACADREALRGPADEAMKIVERRFGEATAIWAEIGSRIQANPFAHGLAQQIDCQVQIEKTIPGKIENCADTIAGISSDSNALIRARFLVVHQRVAQTEPDRTRAPEEEPTRDSRVHQIGIPNMLAREREDGCWRIIWPSRGVR